MSRLKDSLSTWRIEEAKNGRPVLVSPEGKWLESRYRPDKDAQRRVGTADISSGQRALLVGIGGGEIARAALERLGEGRLVVAEPHPGAAAAFFASETSTDLISDPRISWVIFGSKNLRRPEGPFEETSDPAEFTRAMAGAEEFDRLLIHPNLTCPVELEALRSYLDDLEVRRQTSMRFEDLMIQNLWRNRVAFLKAAPLLHIKNNLPNSHVIVAGGGPSLSRIAAKYGTNVTWIAVGTAIKPLMALGIRPLVGVITEPQSIAVDQIRNAPGVLPPMVVFSTTAPEVLDSADRLIAAFAEGDGGRELAPLREETGELPASGSVVTTAIGLAAWLGAEKIGLAGVDFTLAGGRSHGKGTVREENYLASIGRFSSLEMKWRDSLFDSKTESKTVATFDGGLARTKHSLQIYRRAVERLVRRYTGIRFVQLAGEAAVLEGVDFNPDEKFKIPVVRELVVPAESPKKHAALYALLLKP